MNVEEYLAATNGEDVNENGSPIPGDNDSLSMGSVEADRNCRWEEIDSSYLHNDLSEQLGVTYLAAYTKEETEMVPFQGKIVNTNHRWVLNLPLRRETPSPLGVSMEDAAFSSFRNIIFVIDTGSRRSYLSIEAMQTLSSSEETEDDNFSTATIPDVMDVELRSGQKVEVHLSPSRNAEVNILGSNVLRLADISTNVRDKEFVLTFLE
eukprot:CAMPEP_0194223382 /NCGR_PEP_ID=MMETSP0156-20130528/35024_1 /TAXON_ID=33649 /ORGANISM="Thalassionema nitzschioides, Strain L26-B" /LENGTH=207 /DNA_ID=CAMNT_0038954503 /DNA_START=138 /DNA_END=761 /DNA_ORIENTATION=+